MDYFTLANTEGYTSDDIAKLNKRVAEILVDWGDDPEDCRHADNVKNACDKAHNEFA